MMQLQTVDANHPDISRIEDWSDHYVNRMRIYFKNGYHLSVICGYGTYGSRDGLFEIGVIDPQGAWVPFEDGDTVMGWQSHEDVVSWINKVAAM